MSLKSKFATALIATAIALPVVGVGGVLMLHEDGDKYRNPDLDDAYEAICDLGLVAAFGTVAGVCWGLPLLGALTGGGNSTNSSRRRPTVTRQSLRRRP